MNMLLQDVLAHVMAGLLGLSVSAVLVRQILHIGRR